jgi:putative heme-binding domain-containing protein
MRFFRQLSPGRYRLALVALAATLSCLALLPVGVPLRSADEPKPAVKLETRPGDHISLIGNTLADRMQHDGWLETYFYSRFPKHDLVFRNLGFSGDELTLRLRSASFGSPDQWLTSTKADVVFAFFGSNEAFAGPAGLDQFKKDLDAFLKHTLSQKYNGKSAPRLVLFSPIAHEDLRDRNLPDGSEQNLNREVYTAAMAEVAKANNVPFVDLFKPTRDLYAKTARPLSINGVHLTERGNELLAQIIDRELFPDQPAPQRNPQAVERLRRAVVDKNFYWFNRYRTVDGYSIYGGRADLKFVDDQTNRDVMQREMEVLDVMTANRDRRVWAAAQGNDLKVDDGNTPPFIPVKTNKPGPLPGGKHVFLGGDEAIRQMTVAKGMKVNLFASEKQYPELANPVQMAWDPQGRLWVAVWPTYPHWKPKEEMNDKLVILEDTDGDGRADKLTVFADDLHCPTGFEFYNGGVLVAQAPDLVFLKDSDGDGKADVRLRVLSGLDSADTHHTSNSFVLDPGGALYFQEGTFHHTQVETPYGPPQRCANAGVFRYEPRTHRFEVYITYGFANPHGHVFDRWGQDIVVDGTGALPYHAALFSGHLNFPQKHARPPQVYQQRTRPCPGMEVLSSRHFPEANQGNLLVGNVIGFQGILQYKIEDQGASFAGTEVEPIVSSTDPNFRPSDIKIGPDGALYFIDWHNPIIGHMQHNLRDPSRDREHGRIYRVTYEGRDLLKPAKIAGEPIARLLELLKEPEDRVRYRAKIELGARDSDQVIAAVKRWADGLNKNHPDYEHHLLEALWVHQYHNVVDVDLLKRLLGSPEFRARAAATRVLCYWRDRVPDALGLLKQLAADPHPRVRLEAVRAASFFTTVEAIQVALISVEHPSDVYLNFVRGETMKALDPLMKQAIAQDRPLAFPSVAGERYFLKNVSTDNLLKMKRSRAVYLELLSRKGVRDESRTEALAGLAKLDNRSELRVLLDAIRSHDEQADGVAPAPAAPTRGGRGRRAPPPPNGPDTSVVFDLARLLSGRAAAELAGVRGELEQLATEAHQPVTRQLGFVALVAADGSADKAWALAMKSVAALEDLVSAIPLLRDPVQRANLYPKVEPLLAGLPRELAAQAARGKATVGRYVRIELPGRQRTLTLAEVEVFSGGRNVARQGRATQKNTAHGGNAARAIDGNKSGTYADGGQTHTEEGTANPWWEVDLGAELPIDAVVIYNRTDGNLSRRLEGFTLQVFDKAHRVIFQKDKLPAPEGNATYEVSGEAPERAVRRAAMNALISVRGQEAQAFKALARFVGNDVERHSAIQALLRIPTVHWPKEEAKPLLEQLLASVRQVPVAERTYPVVLDTIQLADALAALLPLAEAKLVRKELGELGVRVLRMATVPDQMLYDKDRIVVKAGKPVEIHFENNDLMPHNLVVTQPGALEEIGNLAEATATQPGALERHFVPSSPKILFASRLLQPREAQALSFTAPERPGVYPYVCTYPGHWRRMYGALYVVEDLDEYLADAEGYLAQHPLPVADELLKFTRPRKEWKFEDLVASVEQLDHGRSFSNGKQMFQAASCVACHKMSGIGTAIGADLTQLDPKLTPVDILRDVLEPSFRINEKYQTYIFETQAGKVITGLLLEETPELVKVIENPLVKAEPVVLKKADLVERTKAPTSIMPKGLLDKLTREEILDLIAYLVARGDQRHPLFQGSHEHGPGKGH